MTPQTPMRPENSPASPRRAGIGRRALLRASLHAGLLGALGPLAALRPRTARAAAPRVLLLGDSMIAGALGLFLERRLRDDHGYEVQRYGKSSTGLARPDFFSWTKEAERQLEAFPNPDAVVAMFGGNDVQGLYMGRDGARGKRGPVKWITWHDEGWRREYARRVTEFADIVAPDGRLLFWIGMPVMRPEKFHARVRKVNVIARAEMAIRPGGRFVDIWRLLADEAGNYADRIVVDEAEAEAEAAKSKAKKVRVRAGDGIHLSVAGANVVEAHVREKIVAELGDAGGAAAAAEGDAAATEVMEAPERAEAEAAVAGDGAGV